jgi:hypothetical protein
LAEFIKNGASFDFDTFTTNKNHIIKVLGLQKDKAIIDELATTLQPYVLDSIKAATELPSESCKSKCEESLKVPFKINAAIKGL